MFGNGASDSSRSAGDNRMLSFEKRFHATILPPGIGANGKIELDLSAREFRDLSVSSQSFFGSDRRDWRARFSTPGPGGRGRRLQIQARGDRGDQSDHAPVAAVPVDRRGRRVAGGLYFVVLRLRRAVRGRPKY